MLIGLDFDNTIVNYDRVFHREALAGNLIDPTVMASKSAVKQTLIESDREAAWTELQGWVYGNRVHEADLYPAFESFLCHCAARGIRLCIVSHKTRHPYRGPRYDLHAAAWRLLTERGLLDPTRTGLASDAVFFETTLNAKIQRIRALGCDVFVDDLIRVLEHPGFPGSCSGWLFDPCGHHPDAAWPRIGNWQQAIDWLNDN